jgi:type II secretory pathway component GspD/PulD (secretin)
MLRKTAVLVGYVLLLGGNVLAQQLIEKIDFNDAAVIDVVKILARKAGLDLVISGDNQAALAKRTSLNLKNISPEEAVEQVLKTNGLDYEKKGNLLMVSLSPQGMGPFQEEIEAVNLDFLSAKRVLELINKVCPSLKTSCGGNESSVILQGRGELIKEAKKLISSIDRPVPQVLIESRVLEISESDSMRLGISYGREAGAFKFITDKTSGQTALKDDLLSIMNALVSKGQARVVACPKIATLDGHEAIINIGSRIPYAVPVSNGSTSTQWTVEYIDAGVKLKITPRLGDNGYITTSIQPEVSSISQWRTTTAGDFPVITTRNAQSTLRVKDGQAIVVGGLITESDQENISRLPVLGYIPLLGMAFQNKTLEKVKTEIVFLITPHVI